MKKNIRDQFPFLNRKFNGKSLAYLDNASTTQKPQVVINSLVDAYTNHYANVHRGVYDLSVEATNAYENTREKVCQLIGAKSTKEVIFTKGTTESLNLLAYCLGQDLKDGNEIMLTEMEHHSNIVPWQMLKERIAYSGKRIEVKYIPVKGNGELDLASLDKLITKKTKIVSLTLMSNVLGTVNDIKRIAYSVKRLAPKAVVVVDAAQAVGHMKVDVQSLGCDFLAFSAHKMYGPGGAGVLWGKEELLNAMPPFLGGGDMILEVSLDKTTVNELPWKFEAGTPAIADVIAFGAAIDFVEKMGLAQIKKHETDLTDYALAKLMADPDVMVYGPNSYSLSERSESRSLKGSSRQARTVNNSGPVIAFNVDSIHPHDVATILSEQGVAVRSGHHCAQPLMGVLSVDAVCRASFGVYNTREDVDMLVEGIGKVKAVFGVKSTDYSLPSDKTKTVVSSQ